MRSAKANVWPQPAGGTLNVEGRDQPGRRAGPDAGAGEFPARNRDRVTGPGLFLPPRAQRRVGCGDASGAGDARGAD